MATSEERKLTLKVDVDDKASKPLHNIGDAADDATDDLQGMNLGLKKLDDKVDATTKTIAKLRTEISRTGDVDLIKDITKQEQRLKALAKQRKSLVGDLFQPSDIADAGIGISARLGPVIIKNLPKALTSAGGAGAAIGAPIAIGLAAYLGAGAGAALIGGAAAGAIAGGVALAARDERVAAAGKELGASIGAQLEDAAAPFVPATLQAIGIVRAGFYDLDDDLEGIFGKSASYVEPLTRGLVGFAKGAMPGIRKAVESAGPVIRALGGALTEVGGAIGDVFSDISGEAPEAAGFIKELGINAADTVRAIGDVVTTLSDLYGGIIRAEKSIVDFQVSMSGWIPILGDRLKDRQADLNGIVGAMDEAGKEGTEAGGEISTGFERVGGAAKSAAKEVESLADMVRRMGDENVTAIEASIAFEEAIDAAAEAAKNGAKGINDNTDAGRENLKALLAIRDGALESADAILKTTGSQELATAETERGRAAFLKTADAMGVEEGKAVDLANQLFGIPNIKRSVTVDASQAINEARRAGQVIAGIKNKTVWVSAKFSGIKDVDEQMNARLGRRELGGPVKRSRAYVVGEKRAEVFVPNQDGTIIPSLDELRRTLSLGPGAAAGGAEADRGVGVMPPFRIVSGGSQMDDLLVELLRRAIRRGGGNVQRFLGARP